MTTSQPIDPWAAAGQEEPTVSLDIEVASHEDPATVALVGELDLSTAAEVQRCFDDLIASGRRRIVVDLGGLTFCDSTGLTTFVRGNRDCAAGGGWLRLTAAQGHVERVIDMSGLLDVLAYRPAP